MDRRQFTFGALAMPALSLAGPAAAADTVRMRDLYNKDLSFSDYAEAHAGERIAVAGFMAPPLKAEATFFVLTKRPLAVCPFCESEAEWPDDILAIYTKRAIVVVPFNVRIVTRGMLELGTFRDPETGFLSRVRLADASYDRA
ncbi:hypothetical protein [Acuticoccus mangrovi]|uniref:DUF3299 domain-containing protein n=1 Tax=Acuticoccus mangrovi TaxID=2796142 RepID=A0A934MGT8_9HYPH|nr:hypothetical protein [Acuticoccus mangrovi]MBJ3776260.1 hypothetical protein [Acuticoccus mangrovi]